MKNLKIYGGFNGTESLLTDRVLTSISDYSVLQPKHIDTLSIVNVNPNPFAFTIPDSTMWPNRYCHLDSFLMDGFTLENGTFSFINNLVLNGWGAGIMADSVYHLFLRNMIVRNNMAFLGGGIYLQNILHSVMENVLFTGNTAQSIGGGLFVSNCTDHTMINLAFTENVSQLINAFPNYTSSGFYIEHSIVEAQNITANGNVYESAGAIYISDVNFYNSIFYPDNVQVLFNHFNTVSYNTCCLWTTNYTYLQGWNRIPYMGDWSNIIYDWDYHNNILTNDIFSQDPLIYIPIYPYLHLSNGSPCIDRGDQSYYNGGNNDLCQRERNVHTIDLGAIEHQEYEDFNLDSGNGKSKIKHILKPLTLRQNLIGDTISHALSKFDTLYFTVTSDSTVELVRKKQILGEKELVIPEKVEYNGHTYTCTSIGEYALSRCKMTTCLFPGSVKIIKRGVFTHCDSLKCFCFPSGCDSIGTFLFFNCQSLQYVDMSKSNVRILPYNAYSYCYKLRWIKFPHSLTDFENYSLENLKSLDFLILPSPNHTYIDAFPFRHITWCNDLSGMGVDTTHRLKVIMLCDDPTGYYINDAIGGDKCGYQYEIYFPCKSDSLYKSHEFFKKYKLHPAKFLEYGYMDLDSVCPWEVEQKYGFHPDTVGVYIVEKHNPNDCDSFNIYFVNSFLDPGVIDDTTIQIEPNKQDTSVLWTWEGTGYAYNVYRDGDYITTVEQPSYLDTNIEFNVQYCYNFAPVNERYCEGKWSTTNCYTMLELGVKDAESSQPLAIYPNPAKKALFLTNGERYENIPYEITDVTGRMVLQGSYNATEGIHVGNLAKGVYLLRIENRYGRFVKH